MDFNYEQIVSLLKTMIMIMGWSDEIQEKAAEFKQKAKDVIPDVDGDIVEDIVNDVIDAVLEELNIG